MAAARHPRDRLTFFLSALHVGGAERGMVNLASGVHAQGVEVTLVVASGAAGPLAADVSRGIEVVDLGARRTGAAVAGLARHLRRTRPAAVVSAVTNANLAAIAAARLAGGTPAVVFETTTLGSAGRDAQRARERAVLRLAPIAYRAASAVVALSPAMAGDLLTLAPALRPRLAVAMFPVVTPALRARASAPAGHPWLRPGQPPVVLGVGRLVATKRFDDLIRAFALLRRRRPARLLILGEGAERPALAALAADLGVEADVALPGQVADPYPAMAHAAVLAVTSRLEGMPLVLIEALALGTPVVAVDCLDGAREILQDGRLGPLVPSRDPVAMAEALASALDGAPRPDPADVAERYGTEAAVRRFLAVLPGRPGLAAASRP